MLQSGLNGSWWADSTECHTYLRNVTDSILDGKTPYERRFGQPFKGPIIPFGSLVEYHPNIFLRCTKSFVDCLTEKDLRRSLQEAALQLAEVAQQDPEEASNEGTIDVRRGSHKANNSAHKKKVKEKIHGEHAREKSGRQKQVSSWLSEWDDNRTVSADNTNSAIFSRERKRCMRRYT